MTDIPKTARDLYPELQEDTFAYGPGDYSPIIDSLGTVLLRIDDIDTVCDDRSGGDSRVLFRDGDRYGILVFGWGSCSGCDALAACSSLSEIDDLIEALASSIKWGRQEQTIEYLKNHDWQGDYSWARDETREFVSKAIAILEGDYVF